MSAKYERKTSNDDELRALRIESLKVARAVKTANAEKRKAQEQVIKKPLTPKQVEGYIKARATRAANKKPTVRDISL
jgi:hypothetical protein